MKLIKQLIFALFAGASVLAVSGCSAIGFGIGAVADSENIKKMGVPSEQATPMPSNSRIQIFLKNGKILEGKFLFQMKKKVGDEYEESIVWYDEENDRQISTQIADIKRIATIKNEYKKWVSLKEAATIRKNSHIQIFLKDGQQMEGQFLKYLEGKIDDEHVGTIVWYDMATNRQVSTKVADIERIIAKPEQNRQLVGLVLGGVLDVIVIVGISNSLNDFDFGF